MEQAPRGAWAGTRAGERRVRLLVARLNRIGSAEQGPEQRVAVEELLVLYVACVRAKVSRQLVAAGGRYEEIEEAVASTMEAVTRSLRSGATLGQEPLEAVIARGAELAIADLVGADARGHGDRLCDQEAAAASTQAASPGSTDALISALSCLGEHEREIVLERAIVGLPPDQVAKRRSRSRGEIDADYSRALGRLRRRDPTADGGR